MVSLSNANFDRGAEAANAAQGNGHPPVHQHQQQQQQQQQQQRHDGVAVNGLGPPPDLVVRPVAADPDAYGRVAAGGHGVLPIAGAVGRVFYPPPVVPAAGVHSHGVGAAAGQAAVLHVAAAAIGCQVCGAGLLPLVGGSSTAGLHHVVQLPSNSGHQHQRRAAAQHDGAHPAPDAAAPVAAYGAEGGDVDVPQLQQQQRQRANNNGAVVDPLPDLVNAHRVPTQVDQSHQPHHHHHHYYQQDNINRQQQDGGGAEMMMLYDDPGRCWLSQCSAYRHANPFAQYAASSSAATFGQPIYHRAADTEDRLCRANRASKLCDVNSGCCFRCVVAMTTVKWVMMAMASLGVGCIVIGVVLGVIQIAAGSGVPFSAGYLAHSLIFMGLGGTLVSVVAVVWRCALPEAERRQSCRLLSAVELADRVRWSSIGRSAAGASSTPVVNGGSTSGNHVMRTGGSGGTRATSQQHPPPVQSRAPVNGGLAASGPRAAGGQGGGAGGGVSSDYDYGYWCGGDQLCPEYRHPHNHHRYLAGRQIYASNSTISNQLPQQHQPRLQQLRATATNERPSASSAPDVGLKRGRNTDGVGSMDSSTSDGSRSASLSRRQTAATGVVGSNARSSSSAIVSVSAASATSRVSSSSPSAARRDAGDRDVHDGPTTSGYRTLQPQRSRRRPMHLNGVGSDNDDIEPDRDNQGGARRPPTASVVKRPSRLMLQCVGAPLSGGQSATTAVDRGWATAPSSRRFQQLQLQQQQQQHQAPVAAVAAAAVRNCHDGFQPLPFDFSGESRRRGPLQQRTTTSGSWSTDADHVIASGRAISVNFGVESRKADTLREEIRREGKYSRRAGNNAQPSYSLTMQG